LWESAGLFTGDVKTETLAALSSLSDRELLVFTGGCLPKPFPLSPQDDERKREHGDAEFQVIEYK